MRPRRRCFIGDLWSGNAARLASGEPVIFDPAVYFGDRETDLAMTELFGGFPPPSTRRIAPHGRSTRAIRCAAPSTTSTTC